MLQNRFYENIFDPFSSSEPSHRERSRPGHPALFLLGRRVAWAREQTEHAEAGGDVPAGVQ